MDLITLIVDDDKLTQLIHRKVLQATSVADPQIFSDGRQALDYILDNYRPASSYMILLDINMPVMDGWQFLDEIESRFTEPNIYVVMITSSVDRNDRMRANAYKSVIKYVEKPLTVDTIKFTHDFILANLESPLE